MPTDTFLTTDASDGTGTLTGPTYGSMATFGNNDGVGELYAHRGYNGSTTYHVDNTLLYFDTSSLPDDATVIAAELEVAVTAIVAPGSDNLAVVGEYYAYTGEPTVAGDITLDDVGGAFAPVNISALSLGLKTFALTNLGNISRTGNTGFRLKVTKRPADAAPTTFNYIVIAPFEHATQPQPTLRVTYTVAGGRPFDYTTFPRPKLRQV